MTTTAYKYIAPLLLSAAALSSLSCSNENNETQTSIQVSPPVQNIQTVQSTPVALTTPAVATETLTHGEESMKNHCYKCHTDDVYTRENRFVKSIDALSKQVVRCKDNTEAAWFDEDSEAVVQFLNQKYYKF